MIGAGWLAVAIWTLLFVTGFWTTRECDDKAPFAKPDMWPDVVAVVPARDEVDVIARALGSLIAQDYQGEFRVILVDDNSTDGTGAMARAIGAQRITVIDGAALPAGWTGKLWALHQGIDAAEAGQRAPTWLWLTDADIEHAPDTLRQLVGIAHGGQRKLVSFMALLHCRTWAERMLVPAFIYFFKLVYPFNWINRPGPFAGAAGGCVLVERRALAAAGGVAAMRGALIDDCTLGRSIKRQGPIWLGLTRRSRSLRPYANTGEIAAMIARSAYAQLRYNPLLLLGTIAGLALVFGLPWALLLAGKGLAWQLGMLATVLMALSWQPVLAWYRRSPLWGLALPLVAAFYAACTLASALAWYRGRGGMWKGRAQAVG